MDWMKAWWVSWKMESNSSRWTWGLVTGYQLGEWGFSDEEAKPGTRFTRFCDSLQVDVICVGHEFSSSKSVASYLPFFSLSQLTKRAQEFVPLPRPNFSFIPSHSRTEWLVIVLRPCGIIITRLGKLLSIPLVSCHGPRKGHLFPICSYDWFLNRQVVWNKKERVV